MFNDEIQKIYELRYEPLITPRNLIENSKLGNYAYVKYEKCNINNGLTVEMKCICDDSITRVFLYYFDENDWIQKIETKEPNYEVVFDRKSELSKLVNEYTGKKDSLILLNAI